MRRYFSKTISNLLISSRALGYEVRSTATKVHTEVKAQLQATPGHLQSFSIDMVKEEKVSREQKNPTKCNLA